MTIPGILYNFQVEPQNQASFLVKWNWKSQVNKIAYFQISHSYQHLNETKTFYSTFVPSTHSSNYTVRNVEPHKVYQICLMVISRDFKLIQLKNKTQNFPIFNKSSNISPTKICLNSIIKANHVQAIISCLVGVVVALLLIALIIVLCRLHQHWTKSRLIKSELRGSNRDYYERHRNSESTPIDDYSGYDECESSCTSQMIAEGLAWSPNSSLNSQLNLNILRSKSSLYNHSNSHPSSTPRIMEEDPFFEAFGEKIPESNDIDSHAQLNLSQNPDSSVMRSIASPFFGTASTSTINSINFDPSATNCQCQTDSSIVYNQSTCEDEKNMSNIYLNESSNSDLVLQLIDEV